jgi:DnaK suppressor protein
MLAKTKSYRPTDKEPFMNERQREYFRARLTTWKEEILKEAKETLLHLQEENQNHPDLADRASSETDRAIELRARDRQRKLISKIEEALGRIDDGSYGFCEETGEPIALRRLEARPIATLSVEAQERLERRERVYRDDCSSALQDDKLHGLWWGSQPEAVLFTPIRFARNGRDVGAG